MQNGKIGLDLARSGILKKHVLAALSGGADSVALVHLLNEKKLAGEIRLTLAHFEHGIRGEASKEDQAFVVALAKRLALPLITESANVPETSAKTGEGIETCARRLRHEFLARAMKMCSADVIATAHHKGDQAETVLMHILRGGGVSGAKGMGEKDGVYVRPLIKHSKEELIQYLLRIGETWREDQTNFMKDNPRNCLRLDAVPAIKKVYPAAEDALCRFSEIARDEDEYMNRQAAIAFGEAVECFLGVWTIKNPESLPTAILRRVIKKTFSDFGFDEIEKIRLCTARVSLANGWWAVRRAEEIFIVPPFEALKETPFFPDKPTDFYGICKIAPTEDPPKKTVNTAVERVNPEPLSGAVVRTRKTGDFMRPLGMGGKRKLLSDVMTDRKIPLPIRDRIPVVAKGSEVFWIIGYDISEKIKTDENTQSVLLKATLNLIYGGEAQ